MEKYQKISKKDLLAKYRPVKKINKQKWHFKASIQRILSRETSATGSVFYTVQFWNLQTALIPANRLRRKYYKLIEDFEMEAYKDSENKKLTYAQKKNNHYLFVKPAQRRTRSAAATKTKNTKKSQPVKSSIPNTTPSTSLPIPGKQSSSPHSASTTNTAPTSPKTFQNTPLNTISIDPTEPTLPKTSQNIPLNTISIDLTEPNSPPDFLNTLSSSQNDTQGASALLHTPTRIVPSKAAQDISSGRIRIYQPSMSPAFYAIANKNLDQQLSENRPLLYMAQQHARVCFECRRDLYSDESQPNTQSNNILFCTDCSFACHNICRNDRQSFNLTSFVCRMCEGTHATHCGDPVFRCITCTGVFGTECGDREECPDCKAFKHLDLENILSQRMSHKKEFLVQWKSLPQPDWVDSRWLQATHPSALHAFLASRLPHNDTIPTRILNVRRSRTGGTEILVVYPSMHYKDAFWDKPPLINNTEAYRKYLRILAQKNKIITPKSLSNNVLNKFRKDPFQPIDTQKDFGSCLVLASHHKERLNYLLWFWHQKLSCVVWDQAGLGKKFQAIAFVNLLSKNFGSGLFLFVVPNKTIPSWIQKLERWATDLVCVPCYDDDDSWRLALKHEILTQNGTPQFNVVVLAFEYVQKAKALEQFSWATLIIDVPPELSHNHLYCMDRVKNYTRDTLVLWDTYIPSTPPIYHNHPLLPIQNPEIAKHVYRTEQNVLNTLPKKKETVLPVSLTKLQIDICKKFAKKTIQVLDKDKQAFFHKLMNHPYLIEGEKPIGLIPTELYHKTIQDSGKLTLLHQMLPVLRARGHRMIIACSLTDMLDLIANYLFQSCIPYISLYKESNLDRALDEFNLANSKIEVALLPGDTNVYLATADTVIFWDDNTQNIHAVECAYRIGQCKPLRVYRLKTSFPSAAQTMELGAGNYSTHEIVYSQQDIERILQTTLPEEKDKESASPKASSSKPNSTQELAKTKRLERMAKSSKRAAEKQLIKEEKRNTSLDAPKLPTATQGPSNINQTDAFLPIPQSSSTTVITNNDRPSIGLLDKTNPSKNKALPDATTSGNIVSGTQAIIDTLNTSKKAFEEETISKIVSSLAKSLRTNMAKVFEKHCRVVQQYLIDSGRLNTPPQLFNKCIMEGVNMMVARLNRDFEATMTRDKDQLNKIQASSTIVKIFTDAKREAFNQTRASLLSQFLKWKQFNEPNLLLMGRNLRLRAKGQMPTETYDTTTHTFATLEKPKQPTSLPRDTSDIQPTAPTPSIDLQSSSISSNLPHTIPLKETISVSSYFPSTSLKNMADKNVWDKEILQSKALLSNFLNLPITNTKKAGAKKSPSEPKTKQPKQVRLITHLSSQWSAVQASSSKQKTYENQRRLSHESTGSIDIMN